MNKFRSRVNSAGFTIVELLIVIVIIGVIATITVVSYVGIVQKASLAALKTDIKNASTQLELSKTASADDKYPADVDDMTKNNDTSFQYTLGPDGSYYYLSATDPRNNAFNISSFTGGLIAEGVWSGHIAPGAVDIVWSKIASKNLHTCAVASDNNGYCWGYNGNGQLGNSSTTQSTVPVAVNTAGVLSSKTIKSIDTGSYYACVVASDDKAYCWGANDTGQLGNSSTTQSTVPVAVNTAGVLSSKTIKSVASGQSHTCAIASDDKVYCWGYNNNGQLGNNSTTQSTVPVAVDTAGVFSDKTVKSISAGQYHTCAIASDDKAYCWGYNGYGQLGINSATPSSVPVAVNTAGVLSGKTIKSIKASYYHTCAIASDDKAYCWGDNGSGHLGDNTITRRFIPVAVNTAGVLSGKTVLSVATGQLYSCSIASDGNAYCWGYNGHGQLGNNSITQSLVPVLTQSPPQ